MLSEEKVFGLVLGMMTGALIGWLAPAIVSLYILALLTLGYYIPVMLDFRDRWLPYSVTVRRMCRQW